MFRVRGALPPVPKTGQLLDQDTGTRYGMRPIAPLSLKSMAYQEPEGVSTIPPWAMPESLSDTWPV
ncbi:hypothetical protein D3C76_1433790 [compost metagenome]